MRKTLVIIERRLFVFDIERRQTGVTGQGKWTSHRAGELPLGGDDHSVYEAVSGGRLRSTPHLRPELVQVISSRSLRSLLVIDCAAVT